MLLITFLFSLLIGSFLNVCIYRIPRHESIIFPGSHCTSCGAQIRPYDLIPVFSFLMLHGKCRSCKSAISTRYPLVELITAVLITGQYWIWGFSVRFLLLAALSAILVVITMVDLDHQLILNSFVLAIAALGVLYVLIIRVPQFGFAGLLDSVIGMLVGGCLFFLISVVSGGGMGGGDIKLMAALGLWFGWKAVLLLIFISFITGALVSVILLLFYKKKKKDAIPFGPFIAFAAYFVSLYGTQLLHWYSQYIVL